MMGSQVDMDRLKRQIVAVHDGGQRIEYAQRSSRDDFIADSAKRNLAAIVSNSLDATSSKKQLAAVAIELATELADQLWPVEKSSPEA